MVVAKNDDGYQDLEKKINENLSEKKIGGKIFFNVNLSEFFRG